MLAIKEAAELASRARALDEAKFISLCSECRTTLLTADRERVCVPALRNFRAVLTIRPELAPCVDGRLVKTLYAILSEPQQGSKTLRLLCSSILRTIGPHKELHIRSFSAPVEREQIPLILPILLSQTNESLIATHLDTIISWCHDDDLKCSALAFAAAVVTSYAHLLEPSHIGTLINLVSDVLTKTSAKPSSWNKKKADKAFLELDGGPNQDSFSVLLLGKYYSIDHVFHAYSFGLLNKLLSTYFIPDTAEDEPLDCDDSRELMTLDSDFRDVINSYCVRIIGQVMQTTSEDKLHPSDALLVEACGVEAIQLLTQLCMSESTLVTELHPMLNKLFTRFKEEEEKGRPFVLLELLSFFCRHGEVLGLDLKPMLDVAFPRFMTSDFKNVYLAMRVLSYSQRHAMLLQNTDVISLHMPLFLRILAWHPRACLAEFVRLLPILIGPTTSLELLHSLIDLCCLSAALEQTASRSIDTVASASSLISAKAIYFFVLRTEGGLSHTIDKLGDMHAIFEPFKSSPRVGAVGQAVPVLVEKFFQIVLRDAFDSEGTRTLVQAMLERVARLYQIESLQAQIRSVFSRVIIEMFQKNSSLIVDLQEDIQEFVDQRNNVAEGREEFYVHVVWIIGEFASTTPDPRCTTTVLQSYYETLETLTFEVSKSMVESEHERNAAYAKIHTTRFLSILMLALSKVAVRCPSYLKRAILSLSKVIRSHCAVKHMDASSRDLILERAILLLTTLKKPAVASVVLGVSPSGPSEAQAGAGTGATGAPHRDIFGAARFVNTMNQLLAQP